MNKFLNQIPRELTKLNIDSAIQDYLDLLKNIPISIESDNIYELLNKLKREHINSGPYPTVTIFEAANRIMTDLTILYGIQSLLNKPINSDLYFESYKVEFGNENKNPHDIIAKNDKYTLHGEAFNVAQSFFQAKKYASLKKLRQSQTDENIVILIMYNADAVKNVPKISLNHEYHLPVSIDFPFVNILNKV